MDKTSDQNEYGSFHVTVDKCVLLVEPHYSKNQVYYRINEKDRFLFTLQLGEDAEWVADNEEMDPVGTSQALDQNLARRVGNEIEKITR